MTISGSVGRDGSNRTEDVRHIQRALNVSRSLDGLVPPLIVDGLVGPKTIGAITSFQTQHTRASDGRIDPAGPTIRALAERIGPRVNAEVARQIGQVAQHLQRTLMERRLALPPRASKAWGDVLASAASLSGQAPIAWDDVGPA
ncbi:MAG: peptidoglycan-binding protein, partial [Pseudomonadota bacterium]